MCPARAEHSLQYCSACSPSSARRWHAYWQGVLGRSETTLFSMTSVTSVLLTKWVMSPFRVCRLYISGVGSAFLLLFLLHMCAFLTALSWVLAKVSLIG
jgi:hypothetical protein